MLAREARPEDGLRDVPPLSLAPRGANPIG